MYALNFKIKFIFATYTQLFSPLYIVDLLYFYQSFTCVYRSLGPFVYILQPAAKFSNFLTTV